MPAKPRKIPMRMCVGCREMKPKKELLRAVRSPEGDVSLDATGKKAGRGAYVCYNAECLKKALKQRQLDRALEAHLDEAANLQLTETMQRLLAEKATEETS
ncbi:MAG TPA: YlxR family protein [Candidatus Limiplasma sp.]|nr:YlxR family protein [Candidatus Limiplasma sp.]